MYCQVKKKVTDHPPAVPPQSGLAGLGLAPTMCPPSPETQMSSPAVQSDPGRLHQ